MKTKFKVGDLVRTIDNSEFEGSGNVRKVIISKELALLWGAEEPHYLVQDSQTGIHIQLPERMLIKL